METPDTPQPSPEAPTPAQVPDLGETVHVILIGERADGTPVLTTLKATIASLDIAVTWPPEAAPIVDQEAFPTLKDLMNHLVKSLDVSRMNIVNRPPRPVNDLKMGEGQ